MVKPIYGAWWLEYSHRGFKGEKYMDIAGPLNCPYGKPGDVLWVREKWRISGWDFEDGDMEVQYHDGSTRWVNYPGAGEDDSWMWNKLKRLENSGVLQVDSENEERMEFTDKPIPYYPSIHMPKSACRIYLQITDIRVERLKDITEDDAIAEGIELVEHNCFKNYDDSKPYQFLEDPIGSFQSLWESINGRENWDANPWVWVITFKRINKTELSHNDLEQNGYAL